MWQLLTKFTLHKYDNNKTLKPFLRMLKLAAENWLQKINVKANNILTNWQNEPLSKIWFLIRKRTWSEEKQKFEIDA